MNESNDLTLEDLGKIAGSAGLVIDAAQMEEILLHMRSLLRKIYEVDIEAFNDGLNIPEASGPNI